MELRWEVGTCEQAVTNLRVKGERAGFPCVSESLPGVATGGQVESRC